MGPLLFPCGQRPKGSWTFMLKNTNTKRSSLPAGAEVNDYALTALTKCFVWYTENTESTEIRVLRLRRASGHIKPRVSAY